ncbi:VOC family protein [Ferruginibacter albus]|uniref:VOC family protein n=1 Tax=Ferruginibacter albus TaxID=2875540 RepID=UPI001CC346FF|nr:VOC family protein [Ferruginibacter albus]UAY51517.1 VOC family protein [Ferruginibacter albus]
MATIFSYLTFNGNCRDAMQFYKSCLGGELVFQTVGESPLSEKMPAQMKDCVLHSTLTKGALTLMASDMVGDKGWEQGNSVSLVLYCDSEEQIRQYYALLSNEGKQTHPIENTFWGALFGGLTDKFGNHWLLHFQQNN